MLDIKFIRENKEKIKKTAKNKNIDLDIDALLDIDGTRKSLQQKIDMLRTRRNEIADIMKKTQGKPDKKLISEGRDIKEKIATLEDKYRGVGEEYKNLMYLVPNIPSNDTPIGEDESKNKVIAEYGEKTKFNFEIKDHIDLGEKLNLFDLKSGVKTSGFRGYYLKNEAVMMHLGVMWHTLKKLQKKGFELNVTPTIVKDFALYGSGHFPEGREEVYQIANQGKLTDKNNKKENLYLAGTSEPSLLAINADKILEEKDLPVKLCGFSQCYRSEAGSYGKDTRGLYRLHEFLKVEQVILCKNDIKESEKWLEELRNIACEILSDLKLPHRVIQLCTGDMGSGKYKMYDVETWMPAKNAYGETHSDSSLTDWQSRRLNIRYKNKNGEIKFVHTLNNTGIASPRILIAILENYQQKDSSILVPEILQEYVGKAVISL